MRFARAELGRADELELIQLVKPACVFGLKLSCGFCSLPGERIVRCSREIGNQKIIEVRRRRGACDRCIAL